jgi:hypothetical protein
MPMRAMWRSSPRHAVDRPPIATTSPRTRGDVLVYAMIVVLGVAACALTVRSNDFVGGDTIYAELARSLVSHGWYGFNSQPETVIPPGFPAIMASLCVTIGCSYAVFVRSIVVSSTLGFLAAYQLLRREESPAAGVVICLLLISSPAWFDFETRVVFSDLPYFLTSMLTLLLIGRLDEANPRRRGITWLLCALALIASVLIRSAGVALIGGLVAWLAVTWMTDRVARIRRLTTFLPLLVPAVLVQAAWMHWATTHSVVEWPIGGYPRSYVAQLGVKNGNDPELGAATLADIPPRVATNAAYHVATFVTLLTRQQYVNPVWSSPLLLGPLILIVVGLAASIWPHGGRVTEWYFLAHQAIYLAWPWDIELRWLLPVAPLAGLYLWRGGKVLLGWVMRRPRSAVKWVVPVSLPLAAHAGAFALRSGSRQLAVAPIFWILLATAVAAAAWMGPRRLQAAVDRLQRPTIPIPRARASLSVLLVACMLAVASQVSIGMVREAKIARDNIAFDLTSAPTYPDVEAGKWLRVHTDRRAIVMARQVDVVYHYSQRDVIWFPPISDSRTLMDGIHKYDVAYVVVSQRSSSYWIPPEEDCFASLVRAYPASFRLVSQGPRFQIFEMMRPVNED